MEAMTPKEKAKELIEDFNDALTVKNCAIITVNHIIHVIDWHEFETPNTELDYWNEVKKEIKKL
jgi:hypothetical protein